jgi:dolichol-phosphate mannosyltransferase
MRDEAPNLEALHARFAAALPTPPHDYELIFVDDASRDGSAAVVERLAAADPRVRLVRRGAPGGKTGALRAGLPHARHDLLVLMDSDLQVVPEDIPRLLEALLAGGYDYVGGRRVVRRDNLVRRFSSRLARFARGLVVDTPIQDVSSSLQVFRTAALRAVPLDDNFHRVLPDLIHLAGGRVTEVPIDHYPRFAGRSHHGTFDRAVPGLVILYKLWRRSRRG